MSGRGPPTLHQRLPVTLDDAGPVRIGVVVFDEDTTTEEALAAFPLSRLGVSVHVARMPLPMDLSPAGLDRTAGELTKAAHSLIPSSPLHAIGYNCTTGVLELGLERITEAIGKARAGVPLATPLTGATKAFKAMNARRIALLTPYTAVRNQAIAQYLTDAGFEIASGAAFAPVAEVDYARISLDALRAAAADVFSADADALFMSCTALRGTGLIEELETAYARPVVTSTQALVWEALRLAGIDRGGPSGGGRLFAF